MIALPEVRVAVLDDDSDTANSVACVLSERGLLSFAYSSPQALESAAQQRQFSAFVLDWLLGETTAHALIVKLRSDPSLSNAPIFLLSGNLAVGGMPSDPDLVAAIRTYGLEYRPKPYSLVRLALDLVNALRDAGP